NGARGTEQVLIWSARSMGASRARVLWEIVMPSALPELLSGIRTALALSFVLLVSSELIVARQGFGYMIGWLGDGGAYDAMFAVVLTVARLRGLAQIGDAKQDLAVERTQIGQDLWVGGSEEANVAAREGGMRAPHANDPAGPIEQRGAHLPLLLDIDDVVAKEPVLDGRQVEIDVLGSGEPRIAVGRPLHRGAHPVAVAEKRVVAHADLIAVIGDRAAVQRKQQAVHQFD